MSLISDVTLARSNKQCDPKPRTPCAADHCCGDGGSGEKPATVVMMQPNRKAMMEKRMNETKREGCLVRGLVQGSESQDSPPKGVAGKSGLAAATSDLGRCA